MVFLFVIGVYDEKKQELPYFDEEYVAGHLVDLGHTVLSVVWREQAALFSSLSSSNDNASSPTSSLDLSSLSSVKELIQQTILPLENTRLRLPSPPKEPVWAKLTPCQIERKDFERVIVLPRCVWNYLHFAPEFVSWVSALSKIPKTLQLTLNDPDILLSNYDKHYLTQGEWEKAGVQPVPSFPFSKEEARRLLPCVVKPFVSNGSVDTFLIKNEEELASLSDLLDRKPIEQNKNPEDYWMLQPFAPQIAKGEISLMFCAGDLVHAVVKKPHPSDFRVQEEFQGQSDPIDPETMQKGLLDFGRKVLKVYEQIFGHPVAYGRVDLIPHQEALSRAEQGSGVSAGWRGLDPSLDFLLCEVELIEPYYFYQRSSAPVENSDRFVSLLLDLIHTL